jgi:phosphatidylserine decarboxylase
VWGIVNDVNLPPWARRPVLKAYAAVFNCNLDEASRSDLRSYNNLQEFFGRSLREGSRIIDRTAVLASPADCKVLHFGQMTNEGGLLEQVKGIAYKVSDFLGELPKPKEGNGIFHCVLYLSPGDYHHFHSPSAWTPEKARHYAGHLFSVSPIAARLIPNLFVLNERVVLAGQWKHGYFSYTAVGAYNVGSMAIDCIPGLITNQKQHILHKPIAHDLTLKPKTEFQVGEHIGAFKLGSTIVLVFEAPLNFKFTLEHNQKLKYGQAIGAIASPQVLETPALDPATVAVVTATL